MNTFKNARIVGADVDPEVYHRTGQEIMRGHPEYVMSYSNLKEFLHCPSRWREGYKREDTDSTQWGKWMDGWVLSSSHWHNRFAVAPEDYSDTKTDTVKHWNWNATYCKEWRKQQGEKAILKSSDFSDVTAAYQRLRMDEVLMDYIHSSEHQVFVMGDYCDQATGLEITVKGLLDMVPRSKHELYGKTLGDFKTCASAAPRDWSRAVWDCGYHIQAALYLDLYNAATGEDRCDFRHIIQESKHPYEPALRLLGQQFIDLGRSTYLNALASYAQCLKTNTWPNYDQGQTVNGWLIVDPEEWMLRDGAVAV